jgi:hypothetical protein
MEVGSMAKTKLALFVIFVGLKQQEASSACYIALDGHPTMMKSKVARFSDFAEAKAFAEEKGITLNSHTYVGLEDFTGSGKAMNRSILQGRIRRNTS